MYIIIYIYRFSPTAGLRKIWTQPDPANGHEGQRTWLCQGIGELGLTIPVGSNLGFSGVHQRRKSSELKIEGKMRILGSPQDDENLMGHISLADYDTPSIFGQSQMMIVDMGNTSIISILTSQAIPRCPRAESHCRIRRLSLQVDSQMLIAWNSYRNPTQKLFGNMVSPYIFLSCKTRNNDALVYNRECTVLILSLVCHCFGEPPFKKLGLRRDFP